MLRKVVKNIVDAYITFECYFVKPEPHTKKRAIILRKDTLGDYVIFYPTLGAYRKAYADAEITLVVSKLFQGLGSLLADFENVIWYDAKRFSNNFFYRRRFLIDLRKSGYDIAIQPTFSREPAGDFMMKLTNAPTIIGVDGDCTASTEKEKLENNKIYTKLVTVPWGIVTEIDKNRYIAEEITKQKITIQFPTIDVNLFSATKAGEIVKKYGLNPKSYVIVFPGSGTTFKIWPRDKFAQIADFLVERGFDPVFCGSMGEKKLASDIIEKMSKKSRAVDLSGETDLPTMAHLLKQSAFYFGSDTGIAHLSAAIETPIVCIVGGGHFGRFFPYGNLERNRIVFDKNMKCKNDNWVCSKDSTEGESAPCIKDIKVEDVKKEIGILLKIL